MPNKPLAPRQKRECGPHDKSSPLYISDEYRMCSACPEGENIHPLTKFRRNPDNPEHLTFLCHRCMLQDRQHEGDRQQKNALKTLNDTLSEITKRGGANSAKELMSALYEPIGGHERMFGKVGRLYSRVLGRALRKSALPAERELGVKVGSQIVSSAIAADRLKGPPIDLSELTEEELRDILMEPAKQLIRTDAKFRLELINDEEVRRMLLADAGVEVIDVGDPQ